jgi:type IV secretory pathway VirJ component
MKLVPNSGRLKLAMAAAVSMFLAWPAAVPGAGNRAYAEREEVVRLPNRTLHIKCAIPKSPRAPVFLVVFASGDGGLRGASEAAYEHMAERGHYVAAFSSTEALKPVKSSGRFMTVPEAVEDIEALMREGKKLLGLPEATPTVVTGVSRGATMVVFAAAAPPLQPHVRGAVAIALTRETDYLTPPDPETRSALIKLDEKGRILLYPALDMLGSIPIAVIQSTRDSYISSAESRRLMGPDTPTRRLYEVEARNHSFGGGQDRMLRCLDEALDWIAKTGLGPR